MATPSEIAGFLGDIRLFSQVDFAVREAVATRMTERRMKKGQVLFREGDTGDEMFVVRHGTMLISKRVTGSVDQVLARAPAGDFFGEMALFDRSPRSATLLAETDVTLLVLDRTNLQGLIDANPRAAATFFFTLVQVFIERLRASGDLVAEVTRWASKPRASTSNPDEKAPSTRPVCHVSPSTVAGSRHPLPMKTREPNAPAPARRAKLELVVRRDEEESFEVREVPSALAYVQSRPQRVAADGWELAQVDSRVAGQKSFILKNKATDRFLVLSEHERFLWDQMDGRTSLQEMATAYVLEYGEFDFDIIPSLIRKLQRAQLLTMTSTSRLRRVLARNRAKRIVKAVEQALLVLEHVTVSSRNVDPFFRALYRSGGFLLFTRAAIVVCALLSAVGIAAGVALTMNAESVAAGFGKRALLALICVKLLFLLTLAAHQIVHGLALVHYGRRVREFGFTFLHGFVPTFYVDVTDIFMARRRARVVTAVSGALVHLILGSIWFIVAERLPHGFIQAFAAASGMIQLQAFVIALYPFCFIEMDGYHVLADSVGMPTLKQDALAYVGQIARGRGFGRMDREKAMWLLYVVLSAVSIGAFIAFNVWLIMTATS